MSTTFTHRNLPRLLLQARESVMTHTRPSLREHGLSDQQWRVLRVLGEHGTVETGRVAREAYILGPRMKASRATRPVSTAPCSPSTRSTRHCWSDSACSRRLGRVWAITASRACSSRRGKLRCVNVVLKACLFRNYLTC